MNRLLALWVTGGLGVVLGQPVQIRTAELPWAMIGVGYHALIETGADGRCPSGSVGLAVVSGTLPRGLEVRGEFLLGTPRETGTFRFAVRAQNTCFSTVRAYALTVTGRPILRVFPEAVTFEQHAGQPGAAVPVQVSASWPNLPYAIHADVPWLTQKELAGVTPDRGSGLLADIVTVGVDAKGLAPGVYHATLEFSTWMGANAPVVAVTLTVVP